MNTVRLERHLGATGEQIVRTRNPSLDLCTACRLHSCFQAEMAGSCETRWWSPCRSCSLVLSRPPRICSQPFIPFLLAACSIPSMTSLNLSHLSQVSKRTHLPHSQWMIYSETMMKTLFNSCLTLELFLHPMKREDVQLLLAKETLFFLFSLSFFK